MAGVLSEDEKAAMRIATSSAALVLLDDLKHIRRIVAQEAPDAGDLRRLSSQLRRILIEGDLRTIAAPRMGKVEIVGPDLTPVYRANDRFPLKFFAGDEVTTHGVTFCGVITAIQTIIPGYGPGMTTNLRVEPFQNQRVICVDGKWITRANLIKYVANVAHGVHSGNAKEDVDILIRTARYSLTVEMTVVGPNGEIGPLIRQVISEPGDDHPPIEFRPDTVDMALLTLISTAQYLTTSPDVIELEQLIRESG